MHRLTNRHGLDLPAFGLAFTAYTPLARGEVAEQPGVAVIAKASSRANQLANLAALKLRLDEQDRAAMAALPEDRRVVSPEFAPDWQA